MRFATFTTTVLLLFFVLTACGSDSGGKGGGSQASPGPRFGNRITAPLDGTYYQGDDLVFTFVFSDTISVTGEGIPSLSLEIGGKTVQAEYDSSITSSESANQLAFKYSIQSGDRDGDGIELASNELALNGASIQIADNDPEGNDGIVLLSGLPSLRGINVKTVGTIPLSTLGLGGDHSCAIDSGSVKCWGEGSYGRLGNGATTDQTYPVTVESSANTPVTDVIQVSAGDRHTCALKSNGQVRCWGYGWDWRLGNGSTSNQSRPIAVLNSDDTNFDGVAQISVSSSHSCALKFNGQVWCWGDGRYGKLGDGNSVDRSYPVAVNGSNGNPLGGFIQVSAGLSHTCALTSREQVMCWGRGGVGELGHGHRTESQLYPLFVQADGGRVALKDIIQVASGGGFSCALKSSGEVWCWGDAGVEYGSAVTFSQLGDNVTNALQAIPVREGRGKRALSGVVQIAVGVDHACGLLFNGRVVCWGRGTDGELGNGRIDGPGTYYPVSVRDIGNAPQEHFRWHFANCRGE